MPGLFGLGQAGASGDELTAGQVADVGQTYEVRTFAAIPPRKMQSARGKRTRTKISKHGHYIRSAMPTGRLTAMSDLAIDATVRAAAERSASERTLADLTSPHKYWGKRLHVLPSDYRQKVRAARTGNLILFVVDASSSMSVQRRMVAVKGAIMSLLLDAYQKRDRVGLISFRSNNAQLLLPPTNSFEQAEQLLTKLPSQGSTPLPAGLALAQLVLARHKRSKSDLIPLVVLLSDCNANVSLDGGRVVRKALEESYKLADSFAEQKIDAVVIDCQSGKSGSKQAVTIAEHMNAAYLRLEQIEANSIANAVCQYLQ
ncbi:MAG TPA: VWA domain-containing protein [Anaerolineales bacterium]|nr:VWA domain-containing protein [Anaerolineales bacterium]